jgi:hypothetical protein
VAFFISTQQLTDDATQGASNLYEYDMNASSGEHLIDVSAGDTSGRGPRVQGPMAISADGSHIYFVAQSVLTADANSFGESAENGANNLYVFQRDSSYPQGQLTFITTLPNADQEQWSSGEDVGDANVTPDGRYLVFESHADLTPDDTRTDGATQIFRYDAQTGELLRISIGQHGFDDDGNAGEGEALIVRAARGWGVGAARSNPTMSNDGAYVFFQSPIGLTPHALDDVRIGTDEHPYEETSEPVYAENIYEWHEGQVHLISDGRDTNSFTGVTSAVSLVGVDGSGANVFFTTADPLVESDTDTQVDYYDARICTTEDPCVSQPPPPLPPCDGEDCHGTPAATPPVPAAPTVSFSGQGDVTETPAPPKPAGTKHKKKGKAKCRKGRHRVHGKCIKTKAKRSNRRRPKSHKGGK